MLPGYQVNRRFMEQMMGVKEALPDALAGGIASAISRGRALDALYCARTAGGLVANHLTLNRRIDAFYERLDRRAGAAGAAARRSAARRARRRITATCEAGCFSAGMRRSSTISSR